MPKIRQKKLTHDSKLKIIKLYEQDWKTCATKWVLESRNTFISWNGVKYVFDSYIKGDFRRFEAVIAKRPSFNVLRAKDLNLIHSALKND